MGSNPAECLAFLFSISLVVRGDGKLLLLDSNLTRLVLGATNKLSRSKIKILS